ncbi:MAG TPA: GNAT family N-acetyltransferase [Gemmatimonadaceae bacterium]|nr:GNAT family N-acetyltransferase [Gemmatimonadaceae bacterium]
MKNPIEPFAISFRPLRTEDLPLLHEWLHRPHVAEWWQPGPSLDEVVADYAPAIVARIPNRCYIATIGGRQIGFIQDYSPAGFHDEGWWLEEHDSGVRGIDQFLCNAEDLNRGLGTAMIQSFVSRLFSDPAVTRIQTDPAPSNSRAIRCYEKVGFRAHGQIETPDGPALLMYLDR